MLNVIAFEIDTRLILLTVMGVMFLGVYRICNTRKSILTLNVIITMSSFFIFDGQWMFL